MVASISSLMSRDAHNCGPFAVPVTDAIAPNYSIEVPLPMDLGTVLQRLKAGYYRHAEAVTADLRLIAANCALYNSETSELTKLAYKVVGAAVAAVEAAVTPAPAQHHLHSTQQQQPQHKRSNSSSAGGGNSNPFKKRR